MLKIIKFFKNISSIKMQQIKHPVALWNLRNNVLAELCVEDTVWKSFIECWELMRDICRNFNSNSMIGDSYLKNNNNFKINFKKQKSNPNLSSINQDQPIGISFWTKNKPETESWSFFHMGWVKKWQVFRYCTFDINHNKIIFC